MLRLVPAAAPACSCFELALRLSAVALGLAFACSPSSTESRDRADADVPEDAAADVATDAGFDATVEAETDAAVEAAADGGMDAADAAAPTQKRVLFIGNSYTGVNDLPSVVAALADTTQSPVRFDVAAHLPGGATWEQHDQDPAVTALLVQGWDFVVLQDQSQQPWLKGVVSHYTSFARFDEICRPGRRRDSLLPCFLRGIAPSSVA